MVSHSQMEMVSVLIDAGAQPIEAPDDDVFGDPFRVRFPGRALRGVVLEINAKGEARIVERGSA